MKKALSLVLALAMVFALCACTATPDADTLAKLDDLAKRVEALEAQVKGAAPAEEAEEAPAEEAEEAPAEDLKTGTLPIGLMIHTSDWFAAVDAPNYYEFHAMVDYINEDLGGWQIGDTLYQIEAVDQDGQSSGDQLRVCAQALVDQGVNFVVETNDFWVLACEDIFEDAGVLHASAYVTYTPGYFGENSPMAFTASNGSAGDYATGF